MTGRRVKRWCGLLLLLGNASVLADAPQLKFLFPAGGQRGATTRVTCHGEFAWPIKVWSPGAQVSLGKEKGELSIYVPRDFANDRTWIRLYNDEGTSQVVPFLVGSLAEVSEKEPNNTVTKPQPLAEFAAPPRDAEVTINGVLQANHDVDAFALELKRGQTLVAAVQANTALGSPIDAILQIVSPDGTTLAENHDDVGLDPRLAFTAPADGPYIARLFAFPSNPNQSIRFHGGSDYVYRLTLTTGPYITHTIPMSVRTARECEPHPTVALHGWNVPQGTRTQPVLLPPGELPKNAAASPASVLGPAPIGLVRVPNWAGTARIHYVPFPVLENLVETEEDMPLKFTTPISLTGDIRSPGDKDYFQLELKKGQSIRIAVDAVEFHSQLVPRATLLDPAGKLAVESPERGAIADVRLTYEAKHDGVYLLTVQDRFGHGGRRHLYRLTVTAPQSDFRLTLDKDRVSLSGHQSAELVVNVQRERGVGEPMGDIEISALDLAPGVTAEPVISKADGDTAKQVTLSFATTAGQAAYSGPIRIQGKTVEGHRVRTATTPVQFGALLDHVWLTVMAPQEQDE